VSEVLELLTLPAVQRSALALLIGSLGLPVVGVFVVGLDILPVRFAVMHVALLGIAVGLVTGLDPTLCGLVACGVAAAAVAPLGSRPSGLSGAMGLLMTFAIATALLVLSISGVNANGAFELLWGSILAVRPVDVLVVAVLVVAVQAFFWGRRRQLALLLHDRELAICSGVAAGPLMLVVLVLVSLSIGAGIRLTGALLVDALTILPALTARNVGTSLRSMVLVAVVAGLVGNVGGFALALATNQPPGPVLVLTAGALTLLSFLAPRRAAARTALH
jgi:zinc transport system permease protein